MFGLFKKQPMVMTEAQEREYLIEGVKLQKEMLRGAILDLELFEEKLELAAVLAEVEELKNS